MLSNSMKIRFQKDSFLDKYLKMSFMSLSNSIVMGFGGLAIARSLGPYYRGELTRMTLTYVAFGVFTEFGNLSSATYFSSKSPSSVHSILKIVKRNMIMNYITFAIPINLILIFLNYLDTQQLLIVNAFVFTSNILAGNLHILQGLNLLLWRRVQSSQAIFFLFNLSLILFFDLNTNLAFAILFLPAICTSLLANIYFKKIDFVEDFRNVDFGSTNIQDFNKYSRSSFFLVSLNEVVNRFELILATFFLSNNLIGNLSLLVSWLSISTPLAIAAGNIAFPQTARGHSSKTVLNQNIRTYLGVSIIVSTLSALCLQILIPLVLEPLAGTKYVNYQNITMQVTFCIILRQFTIVLSEIIRGLNLSKIYAISALCVLTIFLIAAFLFSFSNLFDVIRFVLVFQVLQVGFMLILIFRNLKE